MIVPVIVQRPNHFAFSKYQLFVECVGEQPNGPRLHCVVQEIIKRSGSAGIGPAKLPSTGKAG